MATAEAIAIREETAIGRIKLAAETLRARTGAEFDDINLSGRINAAERQAVTLEQIANMVESLAEVVQEPLEILTNERSEHGTDEGKRRPNPRRKT